MLALGRELAAAAGAPHCRAVVIEGSEGSFCAGMDLGLLAASDAAGAAAGARRYAAVLAALRAHDKLTIALVDGDAIGGGLGLAAATDWLLATRRSVFGLPEVTLGLLPAMVMPLLGERLPAQKVRRLALGAASITAAEAHALGLADEVVEDAAALEKSVKRLLRAARRAEPEAVSKLKRFASEVSALGWQAGLVAGSALTSDMLADDARRAAIAALAEDEATPGADGRGNHG
jgi:enoyl-CoA hydratase/carnithine racemase